MLTRRRALLSLGALATASAACSTEPDGTPAPASASASSAVPVLAPVPRPDGVRGVGVASDLQRVHELLKEVYGLALLTGKSWTSSAADLAGMPITASDTIDSGAAVRLALVAAEQGLFDVVVAVPLRDADRLIALVTAGASAPYRLRREEATSLAWLEPTAVDVPSRWSRAIARNHLIVASSIAALSAAGSFLAAPATDDFAPSPEPLRVRLDGDAMRFVLEKLRGGVAPLVAPFQLFQQLVETDATSRALSTATGLDARASISAASIALHLEIAGAGGDAAPCEEGPVAALLAQSSDATVAVATFSSAVARKASATSAKTWLSGSGLSGGDREKIEAALGSLADARGAGTRLAVERSEMGWLAYGSVDLADPKAAKRGLDDLVEAFSDDKKDKSPPGPRLAMGKKAYEVIGATYRLRVLVHDEKEKEPRTVAGMLLKPDGERLALATGPDLAYALTKALGRDEGAAAAFSEHAGIASLVGSIDPRAGFFLLADAGALMSSVSGPAASEKGYVVASVRACASPWTIRAAVEPPAARALFRAVTGRAGR